MMTGWKTKLGGGGVIATGLGMVIAALLATPIDWMLFGKGVTGIAGGLTAIGIGHKIEKSAKLFLIALVLPAFLMMGCLQNGNIELGGLTPWEQSICVEPGYEESFICKVTHERNTTPEDLHGIIADSAALSILIFDFSDKDIARIRTFFDDVEGYLDVDLLSWNTLITIVEEDAQKAAAISSILNRRIKIFKSDSVIKDVDRDMIRYHIAEMKKLLPVQSSLTQGGRVAYVTGLISR